MFFSKINFSNSYSVPKRKIIVKGTLGTIIYDGYKKNMLLVKLKNDRSFKKVDYKNIKPLDNFLHKFCTAVKNSSKTKHINFSNDVMKVLILIHDQIKYKL